MQWIGINKSNMPVGQVRIAVAALACAFLSACSIDSPMARAETNCNKFPTPDARATCTQRNREDAAAYTDYLEKEKQREKQDAKAPDAAAKPKNDLCFKRASGETVCPN